jgi:hypothetical protein
MKSLLICISVVALSGLIFFGCNQQEATNALPESSNSPTGDVSFAKNAVIESVTGSGHFTRDYPAWRTFSMNARKKADGTVEGRFQVNNHGVPSYAKGIITCFTIVGNQAWIGGIIEKSNSPDLIGTQRGWRVVDNGEGVNFPPDQVSFLNLVDDAQFFCVDSIPEWIALHDIEAGNIQVRP